MLSKKLLEIVELWENSNKTLLDFKKEFKLTNTEIKKIQDQIRSSKSVLNRINFLKKDK